ncbi:MAG: hypothetical protein P8M03_00545 [Flavobacteriaceae bacterium]|nr:hypothetical protein [Flavobacteriaceae bacterium]
MKTHFIFFLSIFLIISCKKNNDDISDIDPRMIGSAMTNIYATGKISEQNASEAKKTIFGKWDVGSTSSKSFKKLKKSSDCGFNYIEFTDDKYLISLNVVFEGISESGSIFGDYELIESGGTVIEVKLYYSVSGSNIHIATLTDVEVIETSGSLDATFKINFEIDLGDINITCNDLGGTYSADKDEAMDETTSADVDSNHYKLVRNWSLNSYSDSEDKDLSSLFYDFCRSDGVADPECIVPTGIQVNVSTFGTYVFIHVDGSGSPVNIDVGTWNWINAEQTQFRIDERTDGVMTINSLTTTNWSLTETSNEIDDETGTSSTFTSNMDWIAIP